MTPDQYVIFDQHVEAGRTIVRFWNEWHQADWSAPADWYYGIILEQRPYTLHEKELGIEGTRGAFWDDWFVCEWFADPSFGERYHEGDGKAVADIHISHLEIYISEEWVNLADLVGLYPAAQRLNA